MWRKASTCFISEFRKTLSGIKGSHNSNEFLDAAYRKSTRSKLFAFPCDPQFVITGESCVYSIRTWLFAAFLDCLDILQEEQQLTEEALRIWYPQYVDALTVANGECVSLVDNESLECPFPQQQPSAVKSNILRNCTFRFSNEHKESSSNDLLSIIKRRATALRNSPDASRMRECEGIDVLLHSSCMQKRVRVDERNTLEIRQTEDVGSSAELLQRLQDAGRVWEQKRLRNFFLHTGSQHAVIEIKDVSPIRAETSIRRIFREFEDWSWKEGGYKEKTPRYVIVSIDGISSYVVTHPSYLRAFRAMWLRYLPYAAPLHPLIIQLMQYKPAPISQQGCLNSDNVERVGVYVAICMIYRFIHCSNIKGFCGILKPTTPGFDIYECLDSILAKWECCADIRKEVLIAHEQPNHSGLINALSAFIRVNDIHYISVRNMLWLYPRLFSGEMLRYITLNHREALDSLSNMRSNIPGDRSLPPKRKIRVTKRRKMAVESREWMYISNQKQCQLDLYRLCGSECIEAKEARVLFMSLSVDQSVSFRKRTRGGASFLQQLKKEFPNDSVDYISQFSTPYNASTHPSSYIQLLPSGRNVRNTYVLLSMLEQVYIMGSTCLEDINTTYSPYSVNANHLSKTEYRSLAVSREPMIHFDNFFAIPKEDEVTETHPLFRGASSILLEHLLVHADYHVMQWSNFC